MTSWLVLQLAALLGGGKGGLDAGVYFTNISGWTPPELTSPLVLTDEATIDNYEVYHATGYGGSGPGITYEITGSSGDILIDLSGTDASNVLVYPMKISSCNDVVIRGVEFSMVGQTGNAPGDLPGGSGIGGANVYTRLPYGGNILAPDCSGDIWIEGIWIEGNGQEGDFIVYRGTGTPAAQNASVQFTVVNSRFIGLEGDVDFHQDVFQNQGAEGAEGDTPQDIRFENTTARFGMAGLTVHAWNGLLAQVNLINTQWQRSGEWYVSPAVGGGATVIQYWFSADILTKVTPDNVSYIDTKTPSWIVALYNGTTNVHYSDPIHAGGATFGNAELTWEIPSTDRAPANRVGRSYVSPWCTANPSASYCPP